MAGKADHSGRDVFINCPFDDAYIPLLEALMFAVHACEFRVRCALEIQDSGDVRLLKIIKIIRECRLGIHELSRMELDSKSQLPRFNMPFELGLYLAAKHFGSGAQKHKQCLVLDTEQYRYQKCLSDISGQDIQAHANEPRQIIRRVRDWLSSCGPQPVLPSGRAISRTMSFSRRSNQDCSRSSNWWVAN